MASVPRWGSRSAVVVLITFAMLRPVAPAAQQVKPGCASANMLVDEAFGLEPAPRVSVTPEVLARLESIYRTAIANCPTHARALNNLAYVLERMKKYDDAIEYYRRAAEQYRSARAPADEQALPFFGLGDTYMKMGRSSDALYWYRTGLELDASNKDSIAAVAELTKDDPSGLVGSRSIRRALEAPRGAGGVVEAVVFTERTLPFEFDSAKLVPESRAQLREIAHALAAMLGRTRSLDQGVLAHGPPIAEIVGHADARGTDEHNMTLSRQRAEAVVNALVTEHHIPASRLTVAFHGRVQPVCRENTDDCHARNRRVEIRRP